MSRSNVYDKEKMISKFVVLTGVFIALHTSAWPQNPKSGAEGQNLPQLLERVLLQVRAKTNVPILLPARLPSGIKEAEIQHVDFDGTSYEYRISLSYEGGTGDGFAGYFGAQRGTDSNPLGEEVMLAKNVTGFFLPGVFPTLDWELNGVLYTFQFREIGKADMIAIANSAIMAGPR
jgi:hypothetical protein